MLKSFGTGTGAATTRFRKRGWGISDSSHGLCDSKAHLLTASADDTADDTACSMWPGGPAVGSSRRSLEPALSRRNGRRTFGEARRSPPLEAHGDVPSPPPPPGLRSGAGKGTAAPPARTAACNGCGSASRACAVGETLRIYCSFRLWVGVGMIGGLGRCWVGAGLVKSHGLQQRRLGGA